MAKRKRRGPGSTGGEPEGSGSEGSGSEGSGSEGSEGGRVDSDDPCPCGRGSAFGQCCEPLLLDVSQAVTAEDVMRARYVSHVVDDESYLRRSWHPDTCPDSLGLSGSSDVWLGLEIRSVERGAALDAEGVVEFIARFATDGKERLLHERSRFVRVKGRWVYHDGDLEF